MSLACASQCSVAEGRGGVLHVSMATATPTVQAAAARLPPATCFFPLSSDRESNRDTCHSSIPFTHFRSHLSSLFKPSIILPCHPVFVIFPFPQLLYSTEARLPLLRNTSSILLSCIHGRPIVLRSSFFHSSLILPCITAHLPFFSVFPFIVCLSFRNTY